MGMNVVAVRMDVNTDTMCMSGNPRTGADRPPDAPNEVRDAETKEAPSRPVAAHPLKSLYACQRAARGQSDSSKEKRRKDMPETAERSHQHSTRAAPVARPGQHDERQVVVRPEKRMRNRDPGSSEYQIPGESIDMGHCISSSISQRTRFPRTGQAGNLAQSSDTIPDPARKIKLLNKVEIKAGIRRQSVDTMVEAFAPETASK
jgi:hypothetical protein